MCSSMFERDMLGLVYSGVMSGVQVFVLSSSCPMKLFRFVHREFVIQSLDVRLRI
jgi:hypothetical protein